MYIRKISKGRPAPAFITIDQLDDSLPCAPFSIAMLIGALVDAITATVDTITDRIGGKDEA